MTTLRKLFIGGLSWDTDDKDLWEYFSPYGQVVDVSIKYDAVSGNSRGFGFITFGSEEAIDNILQSGPHVIKGKTTDPKRAKSRPICKKIFVGGIDSNMPEEDIRDYFSKFGNVERIELAFDRQRNRRREFCFIIFDTEESAEAALRGPKQTIGNKECDIKKAHPQPVAQQQKRMQQVNGYEGYGDASNTRRNGQKNGDFYQGHGTRIYKGVPQNYYGNYYGNQYPNAYGYSNGNVEWDSKESFGN